MFFSKPILRDYLRTCIICENWTSQVPYLCSSCESSIRLRVARGFGYNRELGFAHYYALPWTEKNDDWLRPVIYGLKGGGSEEIFDQVSRWLLFKRFEQKPFENFRFLYVPSSHGKDHSFCLASVLAKRLDMPLESGVKDCKKQTQKGKNTSERKKIRFEKNERFRVSDKETLILVDDVVTTGFTAQAVFQALGSPRNFEVWSLVKKMKKILT